MLWPCRAGGSFSRAALILASLCSAHSVCAQNVPQSLRLIVAAGPPHDLALARAQNSCLLLPAELCSGLASAGTNSSPALPAPQSSSNSSRARHLVSRFAHDQGSIYVAPFERANLKWDAVFLLGTATLISTDRHTIGIVSHDDVNISRDISNVGLYGSAATAGAIFITGLISDNAHARETGFLTAEALVNAYPVYAGMQLIAGRERPDQGAGHGRFFENHSTSTSFPSGHAMFSWTMAAVIAHEYPRPWVKVLAYSTAAAVSVSRYTGREHFVADVAVGSFIGYFIGRHIFNLHCSSEYNEGCRN